MMRCGIVLLVLLAGGCATSGTDQAPEAQCRRQAYDDPAVKNLQIESMQMIGANRQYSYDYDVAYRKAYQTCLRQKGIAVRGGVEPVRPH